MRPLAIRLSIITAALLMYFGSLGSTGLRADDFDLKTYITVNQPFQVPGAELKPNTRYILKRLDHGTTDPHVLQVWTGDGRHLISTFIAASAERLEPTGKTVLTFYETANGYARPVHKWFYPGRLIGYDFIYPKAKMTEITAHLIGEKPAVQTAQVERVEGPEASTESTSNTAEQDNLMAENSGQEVQRQKPSETATVDSSTTDTQASEQSDVTTEAPAAQNTEPAKELPRTAGELPLLLMAGLASLGMRKLL